MIYILIKFSLIIIYGGFVKECSKLETVKSFEEYSKVGFGKQNSKLMSEKTQNEEVVCSEYSKVGFLKECSKLKSEKSLRMK